MPFPLSPLNLSWALKVIHGSRQNVFRVLRFSNSKFRSSTKVSETNSIILKEGFEGGGGDRGKGNSENDHKSEFWSHRKVLATVFGCAVAFLCVKKQFSSGPASCSNGNDSEG